MALYMCGDCGRMVAESQICVCEIFGGDMDRIINVMGHHDRVFDEAIERWGKEAQVQTAIGEMAELIDQLIKVGPARRQHKDLYKVQSEIADVIIMAIQLAKIYGYNDVGHVMDYKLQRIRKKLDDTKE